MDQDELGLMAFWSDVDPAYGRFREWHNCEHIPERVGIPGFRTGQRYRCTGPGRKFLMFYETAGPEVLQSRPYLHALNNPTPWTTEALHHFRNPLRNLYRKVGDEGARPLSATPYLICVRFDLTDAVGGDAAGGGAAGGDAVAGDAHGGDRARSLAGVGASLRTARTTRARVFELDEAASKVGTRERSIYGAQPDSQKFLLFLDEPVLADEEALAGLRTRAGASAATSLDVQCYWVEFFLRSPGAAG